VFNTNTNADFSGTNCVVGYGASLNSTIQVSWTNAASPRPGIWIWDIGGVPGAVKGWNSGGTLVTDAAVEFYGRDCVKFSPASVTIPIFLDVPMSCPAGATLTVNVTGQRLTVGFTERLTFQLVDLTDDPFDGGTALDSFVISDDTADPQTDVLSYTNATIEDKHVVLRIRCTNASGTARAGWQEKKVGGRPGAFITIS
jgi:hypothetical protein